MNLAPEDHFENQAWLLFRLNDRPLKTEQDGDLAVFAMMEVAVGRIVAMQFLPASETALSEFSAHKLLSDAFDDGGVKAERMYVIEGERDQAMAKVAIQRGFEVVRVTEQDTFALTEEARTGIAQAMGLT